MSILLKLLDFNWLHNVGYIVYVPPIVCIIVTTYMLSKVITNYIWFLMELRIIDKNYICNCNDCREKKKKIRVDARRGLIKNVIEYIFILGCMMIMVVNLRVFHTADTISSILIHSFFGGI